MLVDQDINWEANLHVTKICKARCKPEGIYPELIRAVAGVGRMGGAYPEQPRERSLTYYTVEI